MKKVLQQNISAGWVSNHKDPKYKVFWLNLPHCGGSKQVKEIGGKVSYVCRHEKI